MLSYDNLCKLIFFMKVLGFYGKFLSEKPIYAL